MAVLLELLILATLCVHEASSARSGTALVPSGVQLDASVDQTTRTTIITKGIRQKAGLKNRSQSTPPSASKAPSTFYSSNLFFLEPEAELDTFEEYSGKSTANSSHKVDTLAARNKDIIQQSKDSTVLTQSMTY